MTRWLLLVMGLVTACSSRVEFAGLVAGPRNAVFHDPVESTRLPNGLRVAVLPDTRTNLVTVTVRYDVGSSDDPYDGSGLAHYVEHLLYEASLNGHQAAQLDGNAMTMPDRTYFLSVGFASEVDALLDVAAHRLELGCDAFDPSVLARERDVVIEEIKQRTGTNEWDLVPVLRAIWGNTHPYAPAGIDTAFAAISRERVCAFVSSYYGPGSATLVISGPVDAAMVEKIRARFATIPARPLPKRPALPELVASEGTMPVSGLKKPTALVAWRVPGVGSHADAAIASLDRRVWILRHRIGDAFRAMVTFVTGDERARLIIAVVEVDEPEQLPAAVDAIHDKLDHVQDGDFLTHQRSLRNEFVAAFENPEHATMQIADLLARGEQPNRYRALLDIDNIKPADAARWLQTAPVRVLGLVPTGDRTGWHDVTELKTTLHDVALARPTPGTDLTPPPVPARKPLDVVEDKLPNGLTVWLAPDPAAIAVDARVVMPFDVGADADYDLAAQAGEFLEAESAADNQDDEQRIRWYNTIGTPVVARLAHNALTFSTSGMALFGDWHVWHLARTIVDGRYSTAQYLTRSAESHDLPSLITVLGRRLDGDRALDKPTTHSEDDLEHFRRTHFDPARATLIISGNFDPGRMRDEVRTLFSRWRPAHTHAAAPSSERRVLPGAVAIPDIHATSLAIAIAFARAPGAAPNTPARVVLARMLDNRVRFVREQLGISYGVQATTLPNIIIGGSVEPAYAAEGARALTRALASIHVDDAAFTTDFIQARNEVLAHALEELGGASAVAQRLEGIAKTGRTPHELDAEIEAIRTLDIAAVRDLTAHELTPDGMVTVVRGQPEPLKAALAALGATAFDTVTR